MKPILFLITIILINTAAFAQIKQVDDALLLDYYQNQQYANAATYLKGIYPEPINDIKTLSRLAYTSQMAGKLIDAEGYYQRIYDKDSTSNAVLYNLAAINQRKGNITRAEVYYKKIIAKDSTDFQTFKQLAVISHNKINILQEIYYLQKANKLNPTEPDVASDLSDQYVAFKQLPKAEKVLTTAIAADSSNLILLQSLIKLTSAQKKWPETIKVGEQLLKLGDNSIFTVTKLGIAYYNIKNYLCGLETLMRLEDAMQTETTNYYAAICYKELKDQKAAIPYFKKAIKLSISEATDTYYNEMADSYQQINQFKNAETAFKKGLSYDEKPLTFYALATLYDDKLKDKRNALLYYKKYISHKPDKKQQTYIDYSKSRIEILRH